MLALAEYYRTDAYINGEGMRRYDRDARDFWTRDVAIVFDLLEESGLFSDAQRLEATNLLVRLGLECAAYQNWARPEAVRRWAANRDVVHNHLTFPALSILFTGNYLKRHYHVPYADDWLRVAHGVFNGQRHSSKPQEDAALYLWLPLIHTMIYSLSEGDMTFFEEGHARAAAQVALMVMDNAGNQAAFGDHEELEGRRGRGGHAAAGRLVLQSPASAVGRPAGRIRSLVPAGAGLQHHGPAASAGRPRGRYRRADSAAGL